MDRRTIIARDILDHRLPDEAERWLRQDYRIRPFILREEARRKFRDLHLKGGFSVMEALRETVRSRPRVSTRTLQRWARADGDWTTDDISPQPMSSPSVPSSVHADPAPDGRRAHQPRR